MSIQTITDAIKTIGASVSGITTAFNPPPPKVDTADLPAIFARTLNGVYDYDTLGDGDVIVTRTFAVQVPVLPKGQGTPEDWENDTRPILESVRDAFLSRPSLSDTAGVQDVRIVRDSGVALLPSYGAKFIGFQLDLEVTEIVARTFETGE